MASGAVRETQYAAERSELEALLASKMFTRAPNLSRILSYVCEKYFEGAADSIKEYNIAVEAIGRPTAFAPAEDSIVRVEFSRLRKRLLQYYDGEGSAHALRLHLPESGYVPYFAPALRTPSVDAPAKAESNLVESAPAVVPERRSTAGADTSERPPQRGRVWLLASTAVLLAGIAATVTLRTGPVAAEPAAGKYAGTLPFPGDEVRIAVGSSAPKYVDVAGRVWLNDRFYKGGLVVSRPDRRIARTTDPALFRNGREGDFQYDIPLQPGVYELHLHFAEIVFGDVSLDSGGEGVRRFHVTANGVPLLHSFDIIADAAGSNTADERVFRDIRPADDGYLHLRFSSYMNKALLNGIEILPAPAESARPLRIVAGGKTYYDHREQLWEADRYYLGGRTIRRAATVTETNEPELFANERWGNFSYAIPVPPGKYRVRLMFAESNFGVDNFGTPTYKATGTNSRLFDVYCNGTALLRNFDIFREAGGPNRAVEREFVGLSPNAQGKLQLSFVPVRDYATVRAIEVEEVR